LGTVSTLVATRRARLVATVTGRSGLIAPFPLRLLVAPLFPVTIVGTVLLQFLVANVTNFVANAVQIHATVGGEKNGVHTLISSHDDEGLGEVVQKAFCESRAKVAKIILRKRGHILCYRRLLILIHGDTS
jgi:hypothetical protein